MQGFIILAIIRTEENKYFTLHELLRLTDRKLNSYIAASYNDYSIFIMIISSPEPKAQK